MIHELIAAFVENDYPMWPFAYNTGDITIHIRVPPVIPIEVSSLGLTISQCIATCPAIERISIAPRLRGQGLFSKITETLLDLESTNAVCVTSVYSESLQQHLMQHLAWQPLQENPAKNDNLIRDFYRLSPAFTKSL